MQSSLRIPMISEDRLSICDVCFGFYIFVQTCCHDSILDKPSILLMFIAVIVSRKKYKVNAYLLLEGMFLFFFGLHITIGFTESTTIAFSDWKRIILIFLVNILSYQYFKMKKNINQILDVYIYSSLISHIIILSLYGTNLAVRHTAHATLGAPISILGIDFGGDVSTKVGIVAALAFYIAFLRFYKKNNRILIICSIVFGLVALFSGTRKILLLIIVAIVILPIIKEKRIKKQMRYIILSLVLIFFAYQLIMSIPSLYSTVGYRIEKMFTYFETGSGDGSMKTRNYLREQAVSAFRMRPFLGWGLENFRAVFNGTYHCHNNYLEMLVSGGILGFIIYYSRYLLMILTNLKAIKISKLDETKFLNTCFFILVISMLVLEFWQRTYNQEVTTIVYFMVYSIAKLSILENKL